MKDIYSPLEIDDQWDQRAPMADDGTMTAVDEPMMAQTDPHAQDLHSNSDDAAQTTPPPAPEPTMPAEPMAQPMDVPVAPSEPATMPEQPAEPTPAAQPADAPRRLLTSQNIVFRPDICLNRISAGLVS
jgi:hypothetical protein